MHMLEPMEPYFIVQQNMNVIIKLLSPYTIYLGMCLLV